MKYLYPQIYFSYILYLFQNEYFFRSIKINYIFTKSSIEIPLVEFTKTMNYADIVSEIYSSN